MFVRGIIQQLNGVYQAIIRVAGSKITAERYGVYGLFSSPKSGSESIKIRRGDSLIIIGERDTRVSVDLKPGDVALSDGYNTVHLKGEEGIVVYSHSIKMGGEEGRKLLTEEFQKWADGHSHPGHGLPPELPSSTVSGVKTEVLEAV